MKFKIHFGFKEEPFSKELPKKKLLEFPYMKGVYERIDYALNIGAGMVLTGDVGSGKSSALRWSLSHFHPSQVKVINILATKGTLTELYKQMSWALGIVIKGSGNATHIKNIKATIEEIYRSKKQKVLFVIDEAQLLKTEVFEEIHLLSQYKNDSMNMMGLVLSGQPLLIDKLSVRASMSLASRIVGRAHISGLNREQMDEYVSHHLAQSGITKGLFNESAITAIHQGSGGILRKANNLARGGLIAAANEGVNEVTPKHIRMAATELII